MSSHELSSLPEGETWNYEDTIAKAEAIIHQIESGNLSLEDLFSQFSLASDYLKECEGFLAEKQQQMNLAVENLESVSEKI